MYNSIILIVIFCFSTLCADDIVYLTWQKDPTTTMTIQWLSDMKSPNDEVEVKRTQDSDWKKVTGSHKALPYDAPYFVHTVEASGLEPDSIYSFRLPLSQTVHQFRTMPKELTKPLRFAVGGDCYHDDGKECVEMIKKVASYSPAFVLLGGDIAYSVHTKKTTQDLFDRWLHFLTGWSSGMKDAQGCIIPIISAIGNHEVIGYYNQTPEQAKFFYALFPFPGPQGYNQLLFGKYMSICVLDSNHTHPIGGSQTEWLHDALRTAYSYTHRFAIYHVPAYPSVRYYGAKESAAIRRNWVPLFERYSLHAAFENHEHAYKRTYPLIDGSEMPDGVLYFGDGSWGVKPRIPKKASRTTYLAKTMSCRQFLLIELTNAARFYQSISIDGEVVDSYTQKVLPPEIF